MATKERNTTIKGCLFLPPLVGYGELKTANNRINNAVKLYNIGEYAEREVQ